MWGGHPGNSEHAVNQLRTLSAKLFPLLTVEAWPARMSYCTDRETEAQDEGHGITENQAAQGPYEAG